MKVQISEDKQRLIDHVESIAESLSSTVIGLNDEGEEYSAYDYLEDVLDIEYTIGSNGVFLGGRILVAFGGPNIWVDTRYCLVEGYWWGDSFTHSFEDSLGLHEALEELWECNK